MPNHQEKEERNTVPTAVNLPVNPCALVTTIQLTIHFADPTRKTTLAKLAVAEDAFRHDSNKVDTPGLALALNEGLDIELEQ